MDGSFGSCVSAWSVWARAPAKSFALKAWRAAWNSRWHASAAVSAGALGVVSIGFEQANATTCVLSAGAAAPAFTTIGTGCCTTTVCVAGVMYGLAKPENIQLLA